MVLYDLIQNLYGIQIPFPSFISMIRHLLDKDMPHVCLEFFPDRCLFNAGVATFCTFPILIFPYHLSSVPKETLLIN